MEKAIRAFLESIESQPTYSESTRQAYKNDLKAFLNYLEKTNNRPATLADFSGECISAFLETERSSGLRLSTLLRRRAALRRFEKFLRQRNLITPETTDTRHLIEMALAGIPAARQPQHLDEEQIRLLWRTLGASSRSLAKRDRAILAVLLETGLSVSNLVALDLVDLDLGTCKIHLKRWNDDVWLPLGQAVEPLDTYLREGRPELNALPEEPSLFISQAGSRMSRQSVWQILKHWGETAGLPVALSPRMLRHTAAIHLSESGRSISEIRILMGHSNRLSTKALLHRLEIAGLPETEH